jgi:hypothetical protein
MGLGSLQRGGLTVGHHNAAKIMKTWISRSALVLCFFVMTGVAFADLLPDIPTPTPNKIPNKPGAEKRIDDSQNVDVINRFDLTPMQTIMIGLFLSLSITFGGIWFARSRWTREEKVRPK